MAPEKALVHTRYPLSPVAKDQKLAFIVSHYVVIKVPVPFAEESKPTFFLELSIAKYKDVGKCEEVKGKCWL